LIDKIEIPRALRKPDYRFILVSSKTKKPVEENWTTKANYRWDDPRLLEHIKNNGNYGVLGGYGGLVIVDCDTPELATKVKEELPKTFTVKTGTGGLHAYFICNELKNNFVLKDKDGSHYGDIQGKGRQVIGPTSIHPLGKRYKIVDNTEIAQITLKKLEECIKPFIEERALEQEEREKLMTRDKGLVHNLQITDVIDTTKLQNRGRESQGSHPFHGSTTGMNFTVNPGKNVAFCFRHWVGGGPLYWIAVKHKIIDCGQKLKGSEFLKTLEVARKEYGLVEQLTPTSFDYRQNTTVSDVRQTYEKWLFLDDTLRLDLMLAVALSSKTKSIPLWLIMIGPSGDAKSEQVRPLAAWNRSYMIDQLTENTIVTGNPHAEDLAPTLRNRLVLIPDFASILSMPSEKKRQVWAQLRNLYDGFAIKVTGSGKRSRYDNIYCSLIACSTPNIDQQILINQDLGTRELLYRVEPLDKHRRKKLLRALENEGYEEKMRKEIRDVVCSYLRDAEQKKIEIDEETREKLISLANYLRIMRATAMADSYSGELINIVYPEEPTRLIKQLKRLYVCLMSLEDKYDKNRALEIVERVVESSCKPIRVKLVAVLKESNSEMSAYGLAEELRVGYKTVKVELNVLWNIGLVKRRTERTVSYGRIQEIHYWRHKDTRLSKGELDIVE